MADEQVTWDGNIVHCGGRFVVVDYPVKDAFLLGEKVIVLHDYWDYENNRAFEPSGFHNIVAFSMSGEKLWEAELPRKEHSKYYVGDIEDAYIQIMSHEPLVGYSWSSFDCTIDPSNGRILGVQFTK